MIISPIFNRQPPNIRSCPSLDSFRNTLKIDYHPSLNRWQSRQIFNRDGKVCQQLVLICIHGCEGESSFKIRARNYLLSRLLRLLRLLRIER